MTLPDLSAHEFSLIIHALAERVHDFKYRIRMSDSDPVPCSEELANELLRMRIYWLSHAQENQAIIDKLMKWENSKMQGEQLDGKTEINGLT